MNLNQTNSIKIFEAIENLFNKVTPQGNIIVKTSSEKLANIMIIENIIKSGLYDCDIINKEGENILVSLIVHGRFLYLQDNKLAKQYIIPLAILLAKNKMFYLNNNFNFISSISIIEFVATYMLQYNYETKDNSSPKPIDILLNTDVSLDDGITQITKLLIELINFPNIKLAGSNSDIFLVDNLILDTVINKRNETIAYYILTNGVYKSRLQLLLVYNQTNNIKKINNNLEKFITNEDWIKELCLYIPHLSNTGVTEKTLPALKRKAIDENMYNVIGALKSYESIL